VALGEGVAVGDLSVRAVQRFAERDVPVEVVRATWREGVGCKQKRDAFIGYYED